MWVLNRPENILLTLNSLDFSNHNRIVDLKLSSTSFQLEVI